MERTITYDFTIGKWGGFEIGDGEFFLETLAEIIEARPDFFIYTEQKGDCFETSFVPNPFNKEDVSSFTSKEWIDMFTTVRTYTMTKQQIQERVNKSIDTEEVIGIYKFKPQGDNVSITNFLWFYLGFHGIEKSAVVTHIDESKIYKELFNLGKDFILSVPEPSL